MKFKIKDTEVAISFTFFGIILIFLTVGQLKICLYSLIASLIHEFIHIFFILIFKGKITRLKLSCFGADIKRAGEFNLSNPKEAIISFSAPLVNLIIAFVSYYLNDAFTDFTRVNLVIGVFNLLPFFSFDGGRGLKYLLEINLSKKTTYYILNILSVIVTALFSFISVYIFFHKYRNVMLIFLSVYMLVSLIYSLKKEKSKILK